PQLAAGEEQSAFKMSAEEKELFGFVNQYRVNKGKKPLQANETLFKVARTAAPLVAKHWDKMNDNFIVEAQATATIINRPNRVKAAGYQCMRDAGAGEMVTGLRWGNCGHELFFYMCTESPSAQAVLVDKYEDIGISVAKHGNIGFAFYYMIFATPAKSYR